MILSEKHQVSNRRPVSFTHFVELVDDHFGETPTEAGQAPDAAALLAYEGFITLREFEKLEPTAGNAARQTSLVDSSGPEPLPFLPERIPRARRLYDSATAKCPAVPPQVRTHLLIDLWKRMTARMYDVYSPSPVFLVLAEEAENTISSGSLFLTREILPYLPRSAENVVSYTIGIDHAETNGFEGSACYVIYADYASPKPVLYDFTRGLFSFDTPDSEYALRMGERLAAKEPPGCAALIRERENAEVSARLLADYDLTLALFTLETMPEENRYAPEAYRLWSDAYRLLTARHMLPQGRAVALLDAVPSPAQKSSESLPVDTEERGARRPYRQLLAVLSSWPWESRNDAARLVWLYTSPEAVHSYIRRAEALNDENAAWMLTPDILHNINLFSRKTWGHGAGVCREWVTDYALRIHLDALDKAKYLRACMDIASSFNLERLSAAWLETVAGYLGEMETAGEERANPPVDTSILIDLWQASEKPAELHARREALRSLFTQYVCKGVDDQVERLNWILSCMRGGYLQNDVAGDAWVGTLGFCFRREGEPAARAVNPLQMQTLAEVVTENAVLASRLSAIRDILTQFVLWQTASYGIAEQPERLGVYLFCDACAPVLDLNVAARRWISLLRQSDPDQNGLPKARFEQLNRLLSRPGIDDDTRGEAASLFDGWTCDPMSAGYGQAHLLIADKANGMNDYMLRTAEKGPGWVVVYSEQTVSRLQADLDAAADYEGFLSAMRKCTAALKEANVNCAGNPLLMKLVVENQPKINILASRLSSLQQISRYYGEELGAGGEIGGTVKQVLRGVYLEMLNRQADETLPEADGKLKDLWDIRIRTAVDIGALGQECGMFCARLSGAAASTVEGALRFQAQAPDNQPCALLLSLWRRTGFASLIAGRNEAFESRVPTALLYGNLGDGCVDWKNVCKALEITPNRFTFDTLLRIGYLFRVLEAAGGGYAGAFRASLPTNARGLAKNVKMFFPALVPRQGSAQNNQPFGIGDEYTLWLREALHAPSAGAEARPEGGSPF